MQMLFFLLAANAFATPTLMEPREIAIGVIEELSEEQANAREAVGARNTRRHVRVAFKKTHYKWNGFPHEFSGENEIKYSFKSFPDRIDWRACYQGKIVGQLSSRNPPYVRIPSLVGTQTIFEGAKVPDTKKPLVVTTGERCSDPDLWREAASAKLDKRALIDLLRAELKKPEWAKLTENANEKETYRFADKDVQVLKIVEAKRDYQKLVTLKVVDNEHGEHRELFYLPPAGAPRYIGASLSFVGAGDYDHDGSSSLVVLKMEGYNRDGYLLLDREMKRAAEFFWADH